MKTEIGEVAGEIWKVLGEKGKATIIQLPRIISAKTHIVYQALGWLAREDKITYTSTNKTTTISLTNEEFKLYNKLYSLPEASNAVNPSADQ